MFLISIFALSGTAIVTLTVAKRIEERKKKTIFILRAISRGDERLRAMHHMSLHFYSGGKEKIYFWVTKQLPMRAKNSWNKFVTYIREAGEKYGGDMRNTKLLKKSEGISEFFKNISELEKGSGEINDFYLPEEELNTTPIVASVEKPKIVKASRKRSSGPRRKKLTVVEME